MFFKNSMNWTPLEKNACVSHENILTKISLCVQNKDLGI